MQASRGVDARVWWFPDGDSSSVKSTLEERLCWCLPGPAATLQLANNSLSKWGRHFITVSCRVQGPVSSSQHQPVCPGAWCVLPKYQPSQITQQEYIIIKVLLSHAIVWTSRKVFIAFRICLFVCFRLIQIFTVMKDDCFDQE